ncbi:MAG: DNA helicase RecG, partial [Gemmatimonadaceae bacterium]
FESTDDGFEIARADLRIRGMGDLFGQQQSGEAMLRIADLVRDEKLNVLARQAAETTLADDPGLEKPPNSGLKRALSARFPRALELFRVG